MNVAIVGATGYGGIQAVNLLKIIKITKSLFGGNKTAGQNGWHFLYKFRKDNFIEKISIEGADKAKIALLCLLMASLLLN